MTKKTTLEQIDKFKDETNYFSGLLKLDDMREMFRNRMEFGEAETEVILAALTIAGAKFQDGEKEVSDTWKKEKAYREQRAKQVGEEMDQAIADGDDERFQETYQKSMNYMKKAERSAYFRKYMMAREGRA